MKVISLFALMAVLFIVAVFVAAIAPQQPIRFHDLLFAMAIIVSCIGIASLKDK